MMLRFLLINPKSLSGNLMIKGDILEWTLRKRKWNFESHNKHFPKYVLQNVTEYYATDDFIEKSWVK